MALTAKEVYAILKRQISDMEAKLNSPVRYRGTVATADLLPLNPDIGDMYNIESKSIYGEAGMNVAWNGVVWDTMGAPIDMSLYFTKEEANTTIQNIVNEYLEKNPVKPGATTEQAQQIDQNKTDIASLKTETGSLKEDLEQLKQSGGSGTGLSTEAIDKLEEVGNYLAYTTADGGSKWTELISILRNGSSGGGSGETEVTLSSISATYTGGDVATGTALSSLTGITVTATYSDGSTANVTGYTLSGEILEGENTIIVSYGGLTTTFTVIGVSESGGQTAELIADGLQCNYDFRGVTLESYNLTGWGAVYRTLDKTGNEMIFGTSSAEGDATYGLKYSFRDRRLISSETNTVKFGENYTVQALYYDCQPSLLGWGYNATIKGIRHVKPIYVNTSGSGVTVDAGESSFSEPENKFTLATYVVSGANLKIYYDNTLLYELDGNYYEDFDHWMDYGCPNNVYTQGYCVAFVGYNRALSDVEIVDNMEYFETMKVSV